MIDAKLTADERRLLVFVGRIQNLIGDAIAVYTNDRIPDRVTQLRRALESAHELCIDARSHRSSAASEPTPRERNLPHDVSIAAAANHLRSKGMHFVQANDLREQVPGIERPARERIGAWLFAQDERLILSTPPGAACAMWTVRLMICRHTCVAMGEGVSRDAAAIAALEKAGAR